MNKHLRRLSMIFFIPFTLLNAVILLSGTFTTVYYDVGQEADLPRFGTQNYSELLVGILAFALMALLAVKIVKKRMLPLALILEAVVCLIIIFSSKAVAVTDGLMLDNVINEFNAGDYHSLSKGGYMFIYPFQLGYVAIGQIIGNLFGPGNYTVFQLINMIAILFTVYLLHLITRELFENDEVCAIFDVLSLFMFFFFTYVTFVYNDVWSVTPGVAAIYFEIRYLKGKAVKDEILAALFLGLGCFLKTNLYIALIAMVILLIVHFVQEILDNEEQKKRTVFFNLVFCIILCIMAIYPLKLLGNVYAAKADLEAYPEGVPSSTYFAMAMQEGEGEWGWYNGFNRNTYDECDYDRELTDEKAKLAIAERIAEFKERPLHAARFYARKFLSQWADPTFVSVRNFELSMRHSDSTSSFARSMVDGIWSKIFQGIMDVAHFIVYFGVVVYCILTLKKKSFTLWQALPILFVFGGMIFHEIWEGSSRYIIRYYLMLLPFAAYGLFEITKKSPK
ncbi:phospholipid carrier-dependent glycosyltransferase [Butyrivibrio sp. LC3010]|uniref:phospholipid carrier-dependent glycosyltransferase n=1 Tax=Butyrivibrio sp. LC3010 TaxID=1280680 RepID=UPI00042A192B|nr:phospholipid carrier-dependent glycosyltransferase [Butyrivibrio sp. LC3010]